MRSLTLFKEFLRESGATHYTHTYTYRGTSNAKGMAL
jgi:hypothetical protein